MLHEYFNARRFDEIEQHQAPGYMYEDLPRAITIKTSGEFRDWLEAWVASFSDGAIGSAQYVDGPDFSVATYHARGTNDGPLDTLPATGRTVDIPFCEVLHYASDGRVLAGEVYYDQLSLLTQLGHFAAPSTANDTLAPVVQRLFAAFDALDLDALNAMTTDDAQGIDELARRWLRGRAPMNDYISGLRTMLSGISTTYSDLQESITGDIGIATCWIEQDYTLQGQAIHVSAPTTIGLRRVGGEWKVCLVHSIPMPEEPPVS